jgi:Uma2 family endonuclease
MFGGKHSFLRGWLICTLDQLGGGYPAFPRLDCDFGDRCFTPDVVVLANHRVPVDGSGNIADGELQIAPDWVIDILSVEQSRSQVIGNIFHCLEQGSQLGWLIDLEARSVLVYQRDRLPDLLTGSDRLPVLAGVELELTVEQLFDSLRIKK